MTHEQSGAAPIGVLAVITVPLYIAAIVVVGVVYGISIKLNPFGFLNPALVVFLCFGLGGPLVWAIRAGKIRVLPLTLALALLGTVLFVVTSLGGGSLASRMGFDPLGYHSDRHGSGVTLFGSGTIAVKGWLLVVCEVLTTLIALFALLAVAGVETGRPFCNACRSWARRPIWSASIPGVGKPKGGVSPTDTVRKLESVSTGVQSKFNLKVKLRGCACGRIAVVSAEALDTTSEHGNSVPVLTELGLTPQTLEYVFDWTLRQPGVMAEPRPTLEIEAQERKPFTQSPLPEDGDYKSSARWDGSIYVSDSGPNNEYTRPLREELGRGNFGAAEEALAAQTHPNNRANVAEACADWPKPQQFLDAWSIEDPDSPELHLVKGIFMVKFAWDARGGDWTPKNYMLFQERLNEAWQLLGQAEEAMPSDATPTAWKILAATGMQMGKEEIISLLNKSRKRDRRLRLPYSHAVFGLASKWGGDDELMLKVAREAAAAAPQGSTIPCAIAEAHLEVGGSIYRDRESEGKKVAETAWSDYFKSAKVSAEVSAANARCFQSHEMTMDTPRARALFAAVLWKCGRLDEAAVHLRVIGKSTPWHYFTPRAFVTSDNTITRARKECGVE